MFCKQVPITWHSRTFKPRSERLQVLQSFVNPYKVLQISEDADPKAIKKAYRKLALRHHPDISEEASAEQDFLRIQEAYEALTNKRDAAQADPKNNGWDFHDWYWDFTMSRRWDSHWKKQGKSGPSPFASTPTHRKQWQAQLGRLKQKAAFRRSQQQASQQVHPGEDQQTQHQDVGQQRCPQQADGLQGSQQAAHQGDSRHEDPRHPAHQAFVADAELDDAVQDHAGNWKNASGHERRNPVPGAATLSSYPSGAAPADQQRHAQPPQPADTLLEANQMLLSQVQSCQTQVTHNSSLRTSDWPNQLNELLCYALEQPGSAYAADQSSHAAGVPQDLPTIQSSSGSAAPAFLAAPAANVADVEGSAASLHSAKAVKASVADQVEDTSDAFSHDGPEDGVADAAENTGTQAAFQTQHSRVQSQLAGLRRRAVRKQDA